MYLVAGLSADPLEAFTTRTESAFWKVIKMLYGRLVHVGETVSNLQIMGCKLHQKAGVRTYKRGTVNRGTVKRGQLIAGQLIARTHNRSDN